MNFPSSVSILLYSEIVYACLIKTPLSLLQRVHAGRVPFVFYGDGA